METNILFTGDYCPIGRIEPLIESCDFEKIFNGFQTYVQQSDFAITNLECPITNSKQKILKTGPCLKTNESALKALNFAGFDMITLANNHILDFGEEGVLNTIKAANKYDIITIGAGANRESAKKPIIKIINNIKFGFLNIAENEFCSASSDTAGAYTVDLIDNFNNILNLRELCDKLVVIYHGGREHFQLPTPKLRQRLRFYADSGADAIIVHHPHCTSGYEYYKDSLILYSLGNFIFDYKVKYQKGNWTKGMAAILTFSTAKKIGIELLPFKQGTRSDPTLRLLADNEYSRFLDGIKSLNDILADETVYNRKWNEYIESQKKFYTTSLTIQNNYLRAAINRGLFLDLPHSKNHKALLLNILRCEAHSEIAQAVLRREIETKQ